MGTLQNDRRRRMFFPRVFGEHLKVLSRYVMLQSHGQVPARYHSLLGIFGTFEVADVHSLTLSSMIFFPSQQKRGANVSCILPWPGQVRFPPGPRMYEGAICIVLAAGFSKVEKDGKTAAVDRPPYFSVGP